MVPGSVLAAEITCFKEVFSCAFWWGIFISRTVWSSIFLTVCRKVWFCLSLSFPGYPSPSLPHPSFLTGSSLLSRPSSLSSHFSPPPLSLSCSPSVYSLCLPILPSFLPLPLSFFTFHLLFLLPSPFPLSVPPSLSRSFFLSLD